MNSNTKKLAVLNKTFLNKQSLKFTIIGYINSTNITVQFEDGVIREKVKMDWINNGAVVHPNYQKLKINRFEKNIFGIGYLGDSIEILDEKCYKVWYGMLQRCYDTNLQQIKQTYVDCTVDERWHNFQVFKIWYDKNYVESYHLDKDILIKNNRIYGPDTCCFVPSQINSIFVSRKIKDNGLPTGVYKNPSGRYRAIVKKFGKDVKLPTVDTIHEALENYKNEKEHYVKQLAEIWKPNIPDIVYQVLINFKI